MYEGVREASWREALQERGVDGLGVRGEHEGVDRLHEALSEDVSHCPIIQGNRPTLGGCNQRRKKIKDQDHVNQSTQNNKKQMVLVVAKKTNWPLDYSESLYERFH